MEAAFYGASPKAATRKKGSSPRPPRNSLPMDRATQPSIGSRPCGYSWRGELENASEEGDIGGFAAAIYFRATRIKRARA